MSETALRTGTVSLTGMQLEIVTGTGGVGKSAVTAALGLSLAHRGAKVLALAISDPRGLGAHLGRRRSGGSA